MQVSLLHGWIISINVTKGRYSSCLNPHIGLVRWPGLMTVDSKPRFVGFHFRPSWVFNIEWNLRRRWQARALRRRVEDRKEWTRRLFPTIGPFLGPICLCGFEEVDVTKGIVRRSIYLRVFSRTWKWEWRK